ncbi:flavodoxin/formate hydrogenlyase subunit 6/NADH:ubiquinone oxidoreductase subunit I [Acetoanaerobium pronyense]|uniref:Flavodoxin/formate hydrogenlyase subunit 6/NADH:ubiquinone oxidoreductase subunit I n=1 Tax=Acetoanaerobium pronyense TaxID=1482736 RepID=A0ABS4KJ56_9FIRM|nr:EFR1 family ferrodoxin [Acetoanaerobium pronyense]MBP2027166.1 flavodoxin/formate hydrogenlyase subunit 6/NADH:ubiquinone oxidoreductase subunit I [Acetoanaerobium pronyense]
MSKKILILYHSGAGSTKTLAEIYLEKLGKYYQTDIEPISLEYDYKKMLKYDFLILGFPTYHCEPSLSMTEFINNMPKFENEIRGFAFTTFGLYSANTMRIFIKEAIKKNLIINESSIYRAPATDGALLLPSFSFMFRYEKNIKSRLEEDIFNIKKLLKKRKIKVNIPRFKIYSILNYPNKFLGKKYKRSFKIEKTTCIKCGICSANCIRNCWADDGGFPLHIKYDCEFCYRCIHHCPKESILLSSKTKNKPKLNQEFYRKLKDEIQI